MDWKPRPIRLPDSHLPRGPETEWKCRTCGTAWPCETATEHLTENRCSCGSPSYWEKRGPRNWHVGPRCYTDIDVINRQAADLHAYREAYPNYPPSHYYPKKPRRPKWPEPAYQHTPAGPGDIQPGTWTWVKPGGLHPGWGDIHRLAMITRPGRPKCEMWLMCDGTVHDVRADQLILSGQPQEAPAAWWQWTVDQHLEQQPPPDRQTEDRTADQLELFPGPTLV
ncbi:MULTISPECIES: hypothetical protein [unclassified Streptomyces]|uniref:hypothetical protein n=1 Tax=unclassified Streptomyces TaxID=2593676 RepID=UPI00278704A6|nr:hypothetical protein [Streptomyces sp. B4I13]MDQ0962009.1 DNA-directed RNA polymerase subunit RPC12/RpoP [Streptomyces sp. B4I13]